MSLSLSLTLSTTASSEGAASDDGHQRPYDILTTFVVAGGSKDAETRWKSKKERIVLHSVGQLSFRLRSIRRVRDPLRSLLPCSFYHLQGSGSFAEEDIGRRGISAPSIAGNATASRGLEVAVANL
ncbi:Exocyst complex component 5 [Camellia lanceoleosa]|uniref:Exocyst complex component 5 n=1 Tax=Camellia lanceoleosa TaxID=1840588 RepID=A0ACC0F5L3_9ERIC|nr:Exocyst complex component 5 [Camellia lanceoleosa]